MKRREFIQCAALLASGITTIPRAWALSAEQRVFLARQENYINNKPLQYFSERQRTIVSTIAEHIIPRTDTPGAIEAGVPQFIELMVSDWFNDTERSVFMVGLASIEAHSKLGFLEESAQTQLEILEALESESSDSSWFQRGNVLRVWDETAPFICQIKELTVLGFFLSETGANQVLRRSPMGVFNGDITLSPGDSSYATSMPIRNISRGALDE